MFSYFKNSQNDNSNDNSNQASGFMKISSNVLAQLSKYQSHIQAITSQKVNKETQQKQKQKNPIYQGDQQQMGPYEYQANQLQQQTKQKFKHSLVNISSPIKSSQKVQVQRLDYTSSRKISYFIFEFISSINLFLQSQQLLIPGKEICKGIEELNPDKVQKFINYFIKVLEANFQELIQSKAKPWKEQIQQIQHQRKLIQKKCLQLEKQMQRKCQQLSNHMQDKLRQKQNQTLILKQSTHQKQSTYLDHSLKLSQYQCIIAKLQSQLNQLQSTSKQSISLKIQVQESKLKQKNYQQIIKKLENKIKECKRMEQNFDKVVRKMQIDQNQRMENCQTQYINKQKAYKRSLEKLNNDLINIQNRLKIQKLTNSQLKNNINQINLSNQSLKQQILPLKQQILLLKQQITKLKDKQTINLKDKQNIQTIDISKHEIQKQSPKKIAKKETKQQLIPKQIIFSLFKSYDDESKQWTVKNNIKKQIYLLLQNKRIQQKINTNQKNNVSQNNQLKNDGNLQLQEYHKTTQIQSRQGTIIGKLLGWF